MSDKVVSCDDLLTEILLRLPVRSILRFKSVSKHFYFLLSSHNFKLLRSRRNPSGLFVPVATKFSLRDYRFVPFDLENPIKPLFITPNFGPNVREIKIEHSCNGLMLYSVFTSKLKWTRYMYNPTINQFVTLPRFETYDKPRKFGMAIAFDPSKSSHYRIICVCDFEETREKRYHIEIFSSQTHTFKPSYSFSLQKDIIMYFRDGVYWNNSMHWIHETGFVLYFNLDQEIMYQVTTPFALLGLNHKDYSSYIFDSGDHLLLVEINRPLDLMFKIHELKRDYSGWFVKYFVELEEVAGSFHKIPNPDPPRATFEFTLLSLVLGEKEEDPFLVLEINGKVVRFNLISRTFHKLHDFVEYPYLFSNFYLGNMLVAKIPNFHQFTESLYVV